LPTLRRAPRVSLIVFDIGNTLLWFDLDRAADNLDRWAPGKGKAIKKFVWDSRLMPRFETGRITGQALYRLVKKKFGLKLPYARFQDCLNDIFDPIKPNLAVLRDLSRRRATALLSNTNSIHWKHMFKTYPDLRRARWPFSSHILHAMKPHPTIFRALSRRIASAEKLGMLTVRFTGRRPLRKLLAPFGLFSRNGKS
jgi:FMN phosphatase YigB (HAD superfamily)